MAALSHLARGVASLALCQLVVAAVLAAALFAFRDRSRP